MTVTNNIKGGLGNQLFQIYATAAYAFKNKHAVTFPYQTKMSGGITPRNAYWDTFLQPLRKHTTFMTYDNPTIIRITEHHYVTLPRIPENVSVVRLDGYFQSYKYFQGTDGERWLNRVLGIDKHIVRIANVHRLSSTYNISMHFRLGDYLHLQEFHNVLSDNYYVNALEQTLLHAVNPENKPIVVYYICDPPDTQMVETRISKISALFENRVTFLPLPSTLSVDWEQLLFMSACECNIIANSSFSWWGAYWNPYPRKTVCYPSQWFGPANADKIVCDMFPENWIQVAV
jgi:hypothetical protein